MKRWMLMTLFLIPGLFLGSGCMMMHMHDMEGNHGSHSTEQSTAKDMEKSDNHPGKNESQSHEQHSEAKKKSKTLLILGGIGMGLMMALMFL